MQTIAILRSAPKSAIQNRVERAMASRGWQLGIIRARRQFADDDRKLALEAAALRNEHEALSLHAQADQHEEAMVQACLQLGRMAGQEKKQ